MEAHPQKYANVLIFVQASREPPQVVQDALNRAPPVVERVDHITVVSQARPLRERFSRVTAQVARLPVVFGARTLEEVVYNGVAVGHLLVHRLDVSHRADLHLGLSDPRDPPHRAFHAGQRWCRVVQALGRRVRRYGITRSHGGVVSGLWRVDGGSGGGGQHG